MFTSIAAIHTLAEVWATHDYYTVLDGIEGFSQVRYVMDILIVNYNSGIVICWRHVRNLFPIFSCDTKIKPNYLSGKQTTRCCGRPFWFLVYCMVHLYSKYRYFFLFLQMHKIHTFWIGNLFQITRRYSQDLALAGAYEPGLPNRIVPIPALRSPPVSVCPWLAIIG